MFYALVFIKNEFGSFTVRALRSKPYKSEVSAQQAILKRKCEGYVKRLGQSQPVWSNVK